MRITKFVTEKRIEKLKTYGIYLLILFITWACMLRNSFNCDTLTHKLWPVDDAIGAIEWGRYIRGGLDYILAVVGINLADRPGITVFIGLLFVAAALTILDEVVRQDFQFGEKNWIVYVILALPFCNVLFSENWMFGECAIGCYGIGYLFAALAIRAFIREKYVKALILLLVSTCAYQAGVIYAGLMITGYLFIKNEYRLTAKVWIEEAVCLVMTLGAGFLNLKSTNLLYYIGVLKQVQNSPVSGWNAELIGEKIHLCFSNLCDIYIDSMGLLPGKALPILVVLFCLAITVVLLVKEKNYLGILYYFLVILAGHLFLYVLPFLNNYTYCYPRIMFGVYAIWSIMLLTALDLTIKSKINFVRNAVLAVGLGFALINFLYIQAIVQEHMISNNQDLIFAQIVYEKMLDYEAETGITVKNLVSAGDEDAPRAFDNVGYATYQINERAMGMVTTTLLNIVSGREFNRIYYSEEEYDEIFGSHDYKYFDPETQVFFEGDTLYWLIY